jgi:ADP-heptose:LPS heptosyltransferase
LNEKVLYLKSWLASTYINLLGDKSVDFKQILVIKLDEIGDMITAMHVFYILHNNYPTAEISVICKPFNFIFFKYLPYVRCYSKIPTENRNFDLIVDLRGNNDTIEYALRNRPQYRLDRGKIRMINKFWGGQKNELDTNLEIISPLFKIKKSIDNQIIVSNIEQEEIISFLAKNSINQFAVLHLGARDESRRWPIERFAACINYLNNMYNISCILAGGPDDDLTNVKCLELVDSSKNFNVVGKFNLLEFYTLCTRAKLFLGNESGPLHIASAANINCIALFGPGVKDVFYPKGKNVRIHHYFLTKNHAKQTVENSTIFKITVEEVEQSIDALLK